MEELKCERCGYTWVKKFAKKPKTCANCNSPFWETPMTDFWKRQKEKRNNKEA